MLKRKIIEPREDRKTDIRIPALSWRQDDQELKVS